MIIIHSDNTTLSRQKLFEVIAELKQSGHEIIRLDAKDLEYKTLEEVFGSTGLFQEKKAVVIEGLHSLPKSQRQKELIELCANAQTHECVLWEKRELTKTMLKPFLSAQPKTKVFEFKASSTLFSWLDALGSKGNETKKLALLQTALKTDGEYFCFLMLIRQLRLLLQVSYGEPIKGAPFMISKLEKQARLFTPEKLLATYKKLLEFDLSQKRSQNLLSLNQQLDLLTLTL